MRTYVPHDSWILRTAWLYGWHGTSFVSTILRLADVRPTVDVVCDRQGQPTWTIDLAHRNVDTVEADAPPGVYHATAAGHTTWHGLAQAVFVLAGLDPSRVHETTTNAFPQLAPLPAWSVLRHDRWSMAGLPPLRPWREGLHAAFAHRQPRDQSPQGRDGADIWGSSD